MCKKDLLIKILCDFCNGEKTEIDKENVDWKKLLEISKQHQITSIIFEQMKDIIPKTYYPAYEQLYYNYVYLYICRDEIIKKIKDILVTNNITYFFVKGAVISNFYPNSSLRTMGDIDLIVQNRKKTDALLKKIGFKNTFSPPNKEWVYKKDMIELELHNGLFYKEFINKKQIDEYLSKCFDYVNNNELNENFHFIYFIIHFRKHLLNYGVGFRQFLDLALWIKNGNLDYEYVKRTLIELNLFEFTKVCLAFIEQWFNIPSPFEKAEIDDEFYDYATNQIIKNGVFGFNNKENEKNNTINYFNRKKSTKFRLLLLKIFPSYETLRNSKKYMFINKKPFLLPFVWLYRWLMFIPSFFKHTKNINDVSITQEEKEKRNKYISNWKLDN